MPIFAGHVGDGLESYCLVWGQIKSHVNKVCWGNRGHHFWSMWGTTLAIGNPKKIRRIDGNCSAEMLGQVRLVSPIPKPTWAWPILKPWRMTHNRKFNETTYCCDYFSDFLRGAIRPRFGIFRLRTFSWGLSLGISGEAPQVRGNTAWQLEE